MPLHAASYFAGVGTVVATMALGFGGGVLLTDAFVGKSERTPTLMERRAAPLSESTSPQATEQQTATIAAPAAPAPQPQAPPPLVEQRPPTAVQVAAPPQPTTQTTTPQPASAAVQQQAPPTTQAGNSIPATDDRARSEQSMGRVQDADLTNHDAEAKKAGAERRKQERRKWAERRKRDMQRIDELTAITEKVREAERGREREPVFRSFAAEPPTIRRSPITTLFGDPED